MENNITTLSKCTDEYDQNCNLNNVASGQNFEITLFLLDPYGQITIFDDGYAFINLINNDIVQNISQMYNYTLPNIRGIKTAKILKGKVTFQLANIIGIPGSSVKVIFQCDVISQFYGDYLTQNSYHKATSETNDYYFELNMLLRACIRGEIYNHLNSICYFCPLNQYSLVVNESSCRICPLHANCQGGDQIIIEYGYWRSSLDSNEIYKCNTLNHPCLGGLNSICDNGYTGIICGTCIFNNDRKYFKKGGYYCESCENLWIYTLIIGFILIFIFRFGAVMVDNKKEDKHNYVLIKLIATHFQTMTFISVIQLDLFHLQNFLANIFGFQISFSSANSIFSIIECFKDHFSFTSIYVIKLLFSVIFMFSIFFFNVFFWILRGQIKKLPLTVTKLNLKNSLLITVSFFQPSLINFYIQNLSCDIYDGVEYLAFDLNQICWDFNHTLFSFLIC